ncbi:MAG TPA: phytoene synthase [Dokdonella sp.]|nr:phytoene synthase [Dokdonella sp.]
MPDDALASFEEKWSLAHPELSLALHFAAPSQRALVSALACLGYEMAHAAFRIEQPEVAAGKLHWWSEELAACAGGQSRHPLTAVLCADAPMRELPASAWRALARGALAQREAAPAANLAQLLDTYRRFYEPFVAIERVLYPHLDADASAQAQALSRAFHESVRLRETLAGDRLPVPLDVLARQQLSRGDLAVAGAQRDAALREHFSALAGAMRSVRTAGLPALPAIGLRADLQRCRSAATAADPLAESTRKAGRIGVPSVLAGWRAARRMRASP